MPRLARLQTALLAVSLAGCGYIGNPLPPALKRPLRVTDLAAVQRGSFIIVQFTIPKLTTEGLPIKGDPDIELRVGPWGKAPGLSDLETWIKTSDRQTVVQDRPIAVVKVPAAKYYGKTVDIAVNVHGPQGRSMGWSTFQIVTVVTALPVPEGLTASDAPDAIHLEWHGAAPEYRIFRKPEPSPTPEWEQIGTSPKTSYADATIEYGKTYKYFVQAVEKTGDTYAESELSPEITFKPTDHFAPAVPTSLTAIPGARSIELVWDRNLEKDFATYRVYRNGQELARDLTSASYSDQTAQPGTKYQYQVSAVDTANNESAKCPVFEALLP